MLGFDVIENRFHLSADIHGMVASEMKPAALRRFDKIGNAAPDPDNIIFTAGEVGDRF